jgi:DNA excision repair protein ERCC-4
VNVSTSVAVSPQRIRQGHWVLAITADVYERASGIPSLLTELGASVDERALTLGDYVLGPHTVAERKTVTDLHASIAVGRFWNQMRKLRAAGRWPYLIIEGSDLFRGGVPADGVRGLCLAVSDLGVAVIQTTDAADTASWLYRLAVRRRDQATRERPVFAQRPKSSPPSAIEAAVAAAPGVSVITARAVLTEFPSINELSKATVADLQRISGVGIRRAESIVALIHGRWHAEAPH